MGLLALNSGWIFSSSNEGCVRRCETESASDVAESARRRRDCNCVISGEEVRDAREPVLERERLGVEIMKGAWGGDRGTESRVGLEG